MHLVGDLFEFNSYFVRVHFINTGTLLVAQLVEALRYKPEGRGFASRWCHWIFFIDMALGSTQPLTEISTRNVSWG